MSADRGDWSKIQPDIIGNGSKIYHEDGSTSHSLPNVLGPGETIHHDDGTKSTVLPDIFGEGSTIYHDDGDRSRVHPNLLSPGATIHHSDGSKSSVVPNVLVSGATVHKLSSSYSSGGGGGVFEVVDDFVDTVQSRPRATPYLALILSFLLPILGLILAHVSLKQIRNGARSNKSVAIAAIITGWLMAVFHLLFLGAVVWSINYAQTI